MSNAESYLRYFSEITPQGQQMLDMECSLLLECKACGEIFRTIMSYISHKRTFCRENFKDEQNAKEKMEDNSASDSRKTNSGQGPEISASLQLKSRTLQNVADQGKAELVENVATDRRRIRIYSN
ncbi:hypothetical protein KIN20_022860 [Parelaphostrongylus tenuis]|uniref:C2H2-type domain-containing protein n=1 Tax=Parelaphostrongylus tenuis TaxID=148309 RepID=A0AAD5MR52_PARTN|nr:hypothetical protein KIN20_022860 [Parelaphostrongylus tenuis]